MIGKLLDHRYKIVRVLANGGFSQTYIAQDTRRPGNPICVVKHLKLVSNDKHIFTTAKRLFNNEAETLEKLGNHDQIPRLLAYFDENQEFFLVQEYIDGHTLTMELIPGQPWGENQVIQLLLEILEVLEFVHQQGVIHRDIKPDNLIRRVDDYKLVLVDFGAVKQVHCHSMLLQHKLNPTIAIGTPGYMPTEQGQGKPRPSSDIYALGIIAIQALTGIAASQFPEDPDTGEILWQHFRPVNSHLGEILSKMVRYHFKERYQTATEALEVCREFIKDYAKSFGYSLPPTPTTPSGRKSPIKTYNQSVSLFPQPTLALAPVHTSKVEIAPKQEQKPDPLPLVIGLFLVGGATALVANLYPNLQTLTANWKHKNGTSPKNCLAIVAPNSNVRSQPSAISSDNILKSIGDASEFIVTGKRTKRGWIEVKFKSGRLAWAHSDVITNNDQWVSCLRDKGISLQIVDDLPLITSRLVPKPQLSPMTSPSPLLPQSADTESQDPIVLQARQKFQSGDVNGAIAQLKSAPQKTTSNSQQVKIIDQWQQDWAKAETLANEINRAIDSGQWEKVLAYRNQPEKLPNIKYWQEKLEPLFKQAAQKVAQQVLPDQNPQPVTNSKTKP
ncbi:serine/threonine protein kinase [Raphidiopsis curvata NIES-932]|nr:serine/threonine protein kinase [Raphidiopsis curvata NIES-932]